MLKFILSFVVLMMSASALAVDFARYFNFDGQLLDPATLAPKAGPVNITVQLWDTSGTCLLYEETHTSVTLGAEDGVFSIKVGPDGDGVRSSSSIDGGLSWNMIFQNDTQLRPSSAANCTAGYTPANNDGRKMRVTVDGTALSPDYSLSPAPWATVAQTLQGKVPADFLKVIGDGDIDGNLTIKNQKELRLSASGTNYVALKSPASLANNLIFTLPSSSGSNGDVLTTNGSGVLSWSAPVVSTGDITEVVTNIGSALTGGMTSGAVTLAVSVDATTIEIVSNQLKVKDAAITSAKLIDGSVTSSKILDGAITASDLANGSVTDSKIDAVGITKITTGPSEYFTYTPGGTACTNGQFLAWNSINSRWECDSLWIPPSHNIIDGDNNTYVDVESTTNENKIHFYTGGTERMIIGADGKVGIGTQGVTAILDIMAPTDSSGINTYASSTVTASQTVSLNRFQGSYNPSSSAAAKVTAVESSIQTTGSASLVSSHLSAVKGIAEHNTSSSAGDMVGGEWRASNLMTGTILNAYGSISRVENNTTGSVNAAYGNYSEVAINGGTISTAYGLYSKFINTSGTISTGFGLYIGQILANTKFGIYVSDSNATNVLMGKLAIGTATPQATLDVNGFMKLAVNNAQPTTCTTGLRGSIAVTSNHRICVCDGGSWVLSSDGATACGW